eukprot:Phypoly_transcript_06127.p1 GENE.Phypoly_transcript_06127~~Phypoly_transcript_06127.p1  ORF type:complete len:593 (+),score=95.33 Phypoly_transcript_06127:77-1780(+)
MSEVEGHDPHEVDEPHTALSGNDSFEKWMQPFLLCTAAAKGDLQKLQHLVEVKNIDINTADYDGRTALHLASEEGHLEVVKYLLGKGANINCEDRWGTVPLRGAISFNRNVVGMNVEDAIDRAIHVASYLREKGATLNFASKRADDIIQSGELAVKAEERMEELKRIFKEIDTNSDGNNISLKSVSKILQSNGLFRKRIKPIDFHLKQIDQANENRGQMSFSQFVELMSASNTSTLARGLKDHLVVPHWKQFCKDVEAIFESCKDIHDGKNADYIPELAEVDPEMWGLSIVTVDGQTFNLGNFDIGFSIQSCGKPLQYALCAEEIGIDKIHEYVGQEPSGVAFNAFTLNSQKKPHNPLINSGAIMTSSMFSPTLILPKRFKKLTQQFSDLAGGEKIAFSQSVYLSEKSVAHRNFALAHFMKSEGGFPPNVNILEVVDFYFQMCSMEVDCKTLASIASTFANNGKNPLSDKKMLSSPVVKHTLQLMYSCGMYDFSGEWACTIGLPAKSGVSGSLMVVIPDVMGMAVWAPRLDEHGNSVRGMEFCRRLTEKFNWSLFDVLFAKFDNREK